MGILEQIVGAFMIGFIGGAVPGPVLTTAMAESLRKGFIGSLHLVFKAMLVELILASFILIVFSLLDIGQSFFYAISFAGAAVLVWFASRMWKIKDINEGGEMFSFVKIFLLMASNGLFWIYWLTVCVPQAFLLGQAVAFGQLLFMMVFVLGWMISTIAAVFVFTRFRFVLLKKNLIPIAFKFFSLLFVLFAVKISYESVIFFIK